MSAYFLSLSAIGSVMRLPLGHLVLWGGLVLLSGVLIVLVATRWGKTRPVHTCAVLSLLAHVLLACLATVVRLVGELDQVAEGRPMRVRLVEEVLVEKVPLVPAEPTAGSESQDGDSHDSGELQEDLSQGSQEIVAHESQSTPETVDGNPQNGHDTADVPMLDSELQPKESSESQHTSQAQGGQETADAPALAAPPLSDTSKQSASEDVSHEGEPPIHEGEPPIQDTVAELESSTSALSQPFEAAPPIPPATSVAGAAAPDTNHTTNQDVPDAPSELPNLHQSDSLTTVPPKPPAGEAVPSLPTAATQPTDGSPSVQEPTGEFAESRWSGGQRRANSSVPLPDGPSNPYANRTRGDRLGFVEREGGSRETETAVRAALGWLANAQSEDGRWNAGRYGAGREQAVLGQHRNGAGARADTGVSALALLAFLGAGYTHTSGDHRGTVVDGLQFLLDSQTADGNLGGNATVYAQMYCHSMATFALAEALAITGDGRLKPAVARAVRYSLQAQNVANGGWRYRPGDTGDTSQLGWQLMALRSAELGGISVPAKTWTGAERFLRSVTRGTNGGLASYRPESPASRSMTAEALYCRQLLAEILGGRHDRQATEEAGGYLLGELPGDGLFNLYYWYYATLALHDQRLADERATANWAQWNRAMKRTLLGSQVGQGPEAGSWGPDTVWGGYGGRVYTTALAALCLEVYYRYTPEPSDGPEWIASEPDGQSQPR